MIKPSISLRSLAKPWSNELDPSHMSSYSENKKLSDFELIGETKDIVLTDGKGAFTGWIPYSVVIQEALSQWKLLRAFYNAILDSVDDAITVIDDQGKIVSWNHRSEEMYGHSTNEVLGHSIDRFFQEEDIVLISTIREGQGVSRKYNQPSPNVHVLINTVPVQVDGRIVGGISVERDITDIVKLNDELSSTTAYLHDLEKEMKKDQTNYPFQKIKGRSPALRTALEVVRKVSATDATVLITGESGVGKELFAEAIHHQSRRSEQSFVAINCGAIPASLFESELFGYERGAFTGAIKEGKKGKVDLAAKGSLFLDEIGEMPLDLQVKLLRVIQERQFYRVGGQQPIPVNMRIVAATNRNLEEMIERGTFREDLYYRLNVVSIAIPPLRERIEDIPELIQLFLKEFSLKYSKPAPKLDPEVMFILLHHQWPGNIRQLRNIIERLLILSGEEDMIKPHHLPNNLITKPAQSPSIISLAGSASPAAHIGDEETRIRQALQTTYGNKSAAAKLLGLSRATLYSKIKSFGLE
jgi:PAS domain S-box-containing protein